MSSNNKKSFFYTGSFDEDEETKSMQSMDNVHSMSVHSSMLNHSHNLTEQILMDADSEIESMLSKEDEAILRGRVHQTHNFMMNKQKPVFISAASTNLNFNDDDPDAQSGSEDISQKIKRNNQLKTNLEKGESCFDF